MLAILDKSNNKKFITGFEVKGLEGGSDTMLISLIIHYMMYTMLI